MRETQRIANTISESSKAGRKFSLFGEDSKSAEEAVSFARKREEK